MTHAGTTDTLETIVSRVHKLRRLAQSSNPHEAASAATKAQALTDKYRLTPARLAYDPDEPSSRAVYAMAIEKMQRLTKELQQRTRDALHPTPEQQQRMAEDLRRQHDLERRLWERERQARREDRQLLRVLRTRAQPLGLSIRHHRRLAGRYQVGAPGRPWACCQGLSAVEQAIVAAECGAA